MNRKKPDPPDRPDLLEQIRQLKEKLQSLQQGAPDAPAKPEGLAAGIAESLGRLVPGLAGLIRSASQMPEFQQKLAAIDEEVRRRFKDQPLRGAASGLGGIAGHRQMGIPPSVRRGISSRPARQGQNSGKPASHGRYREPGPPKVHISPETPASLPADIFDEGRSLVVLAEASGLNLEHFTVELDGTVLLITIDAPHRQGCQRIELPCEVAGPPQTSLTNGILRIQLRKAPKP